MADTTVLTKKKPVVECNSKSDDYEPRRPQQQQPQRTSRRSPCLCRFLRTAAGCRNGAECTFAHVDVPCFWDDERVQQAPVVSERGDVVLVATQFQTVALKVKVRRDAGAATAKLLVLALAAGAVGLVWLASAELDH